MRRFPQIGFKSAGFIFALDIAGTFLFAVEGAVAGADAGLDAFGILVMSFSVALIGGLVRDLLIGAVPPQAIKDWRYPAVAFAGGIVTFFLHRYVIAIPRPVFITLAERGIVPEALLGAIAAALRFNDPADAEAVELAQILNSSRPEDATTKITGLDSGHPLFPAVCALVEEAKAAV